MPRLSTLRRRPLRVGLAAVMAAAVLAPSAVVAHGALTSNELDLRAVKRVTVTHDRVGAMVTSPTWQDAPGGTATIKTAQAGAIIARYNVVAFCAGSLYCTARILVDGEETNPTDPVGAALAGRDQMGSYTIERSTGVLPAGEHTVKVQVRLFVPDDSAVLYLQTSHLTVEEAAA